MSDFSIGVRRQTLSRWVTLIIRTGTTSIAYSLPLQCLESNQNSTTCPPPNPSIWSLWINLCHQLESLFRWSFRLVLNCDGTTPRVLSKTIDLTTMNWSRSLVGVSLGLNVPTIYNSESSLEFPFRVPPLPLSSNTIDSDSHRNFSFRRIGLQSNGLIFTIDLGDQQWRSIPLI